MLKLCYKDYLSSRWLWLCVVVLYVLYIIQPMGRVTLIMTFGALAVYATLAVTLIYEDQNKTEVLYASLPLTRRTIVHGRYLLTGFILLGGAAVIFGSAALTLVRLKAPAYQEALSPLLSVDGVTGYFIGAVFLLMSFLPFSYRFGLGRGIILHFSGLSVLVVAVAGLDKLVSGPLHLASPVFAAGFLQNPGGEILRALGYAREAIGPSLFILCVLALLILQVSISIRISTRVYQRKEL
jgi:hypothetical protein